MSEHNTKTNKSKGEKLAQRLSHILALLHQGDCLDKHSMAQIFQVDVRTIERDLIERLHGIAERSPEGCWQLTHSSRSLIPTKHLHSYAQLSGTQNLFPDNSLRYLLTHLESPDTHRATQVQPVFQEDLKAHGPIFAKLETAIKQCIECHFKYKGTLRKVQPYRLIHQHGIWYLAATENERLKNFSVAIITELHVEECIRFTSKPDLHEYINNKEDIWLTPQIIEVVLRVAPSVAHYFTRRPLLPKQHHRTDADGSLLITSQVSHPLQILPVVRYWLPHVRILRPLKWHDELVTELKQALDLWGTKPLTQI
jgi:predicted DNA-binding transcriptional regulator YafY